MSIFLEYAKKETSKLHNLLTEIQADKKGEGDDNEASKKHKNNFNLKDAIEAALAKMARDAFNDSTKKIPAGFDEFARSQPFKDLL